MAAFIVRGIPDSLRKDAWWLAEHPITTSNRQRRAPLTSPRISRQVDRSLLRPHTGTPKTRFPSA